MTPRPLPEIANALCLELKAPARLLAHLKLVHDVAIDLIEALEKRFPQILFDRQAVLFGAATHDIGKVLHPNEITGPGTHHEQDGYSLLVSLGVPAQLARFANTHGARDGLDSLPLEDLLVAIADTSWKGQRRSELELILTKSISKNIGVQTWEVFASLDDVLQRITESADDRLNYQISKN